MFLLLHNRCSTDIFQKKERTFCTKYSARDLLFFDIKAYKLGKLKLYVAFSESLPTFPQLVKFIGQVRSYSNPPFAANKTILPNNVKYVGFPNSDS